MFPSDKYEISGDKRNEKNEGMHVAVCGISHELAQWQGERAAQNYKINTPAHEPFIGRAASSTVRARSPQLGYQFLLSSRSSLFLKNHAVITLSRFLSRTAGVRSHGIAGIDDAMQPSPPVHDNLPNCDSWLLGPSRNCQRLPDSI